MYRADLYVAGRSKRNIALENDNPCTLGFFQLCVQGLQQLYPSSETELLELWGIVDPNDTGRVDIEAFLSALHTRSNRPPSPHVGPAHYNPRYPM